MFLFFFFQEKLPEISFFRLLKLNKSEWPYILFGILAASVNGAAHPGFSIIFAKFIAVSIFISKYIVGKTTIDNYSNGRLPKYVGHHC